MHFLRVGIGLVLGVPFAVILQRDHLLVGRRNAPERSAITISLVRILVDVVTKVQNRVEIGSPREAGIGVEVSLGQVRARHHAQPQSAHAFARQRARATDRGTRAQRFKTVVIGSACREARHIDLHGEVAGGASPRLTARDHLAEFRIARDLPRHRHFASRRRGRHSGPQDDAIGQRVATGHAMPEYRIGGLRKRGGANQREGAQRYAAGGQEIAARNSAHGAEV